MNQSIASIALLVRDYDEAIAYYTHVLGFELLEDTPLDDVKRWVRVRPAGTLKGSALLLARATTPYQHEAVGNQSGGRVFLFLETDDFDADYKNYSARGVKFIEHPRSETYGRVVVFEDIYGNRWDLVERQI